MGTHDPSAMQRRLTNLGSVINTAKRLANLEQVLPRAETCTPVPTPPTPPITVQADKVLKLVQPPQSCTLAPPPLVTVVPSTSVHADTRGETLWSEDLGSDGAKLTVVPSTTVHAD